jgi:hypothetical protein
VSPLLELLLCSRHTSIERIFVSLILTTDVSSTGRLPIFLVALFSLPAAHRRFTNERGQLLDFFGSVQLEDELQDASYH